MTHGKHANQGRTSLRQMTEKSSQGESAFPSLLVMTSSSLNHQIKKNVHRKQTVKEKNTERGQNLQNGFKMVLSLNIVCFHI